MKTLKIYLFTALIISGHLAFSQTGSWKLSGNSLTGTEKFGSTNAKPVNFVSKNIQRMIIDTGGRVGIGTVFPQGALNVTRGDAAIAANPNSVIVAESSSDAFISILAPGSKKTGLIFGTTVNGIVSPADGGIIYNEAKVLRGFQFNTGGNITRMALTGAGLLGLGTSTPKANFHILKGISGVSTPNTNSSFITESGGDNFISLLNPASNTSGILFANTLNPSDGGIIYNSLSTPRGLQFNSNGNNTRMVITNNGFVGIGTKTPKTELHLIHGNINGTTNGLRIENISTGQNWGFFSSAAGFLFLTKNGLTQGFFDNDGSGEYTSTSDARRKKDVEQASDVMEKVLQLNVKKYRFVGNKSTSKKHYGMIAQDVEKLFPEIVTHLTDNGHDLYTVNYNGYGVIAIKAIQEQQKVIEKQQSDIEVMKAMMNDLKARIDQLSRTNSYDKVSSQSDKVVELTGARLMQNAPNPFNALTTINYYLPDIKGRAAIDIISSGGQLIKTYPVTQRGNGQLSIKSGEFATGSYSYILRIDGVKVDARQMVLVK